MSKILNKLGIKTRQQNADDEARRQQRLQDVEDYNKFGRTRKTYGIAQLDAGETLRTGKNVFKKGDVIENKGGRIGVGNFDSLRKQKGGKSEAAGNLGDTTYGDSTYKPTKGSRDNMSKKDIRRERKILAKEGRKNRRAEKMADDKGMSNQQAKDFMQNRRDRFRQMGTNFVKGLTGQAMDTAVDDRLYRRDGSGTLQNMKTEDGKTVDATSPYKGSASKGFTDRGQSRNEADDYVRSLNPKKDDDLPSKMITIPAYKVPEPKEVIEEDTENKNKISLTPTEPYKGHKIDSSDQMPYTATENVTQDKNIYTPEQQRLNEMRKSEFSRKAPLGSSLGMSMFGLPLGAASGMINLAGNLISRKAGEKQKKNIDRFAGRSGG